MGGTNGHLIEWTILLPLQFFQQQLSAMLLKLTTGLEVAAELAKNC